MNNDFLENSQLVRCFPIKKPGSLFTLDRVGSYLRVCLQTGPEFHWLIIIFPEQHGDLGGVYLCILMILMVFCDHGHHSSYNLMVFSPLHHMIWSFSMGFLQVPCGLWETRWETVPGVPGVQAHLQQAALLKKVAESMKDLWLGSEGWLGWLAGFITIFPWVKSLEKLSHDEKFSSF